MSRNDFEELKRLIEFARAEAKEDIAALKGEITLMRTSLLSCQKRCHVQNQDQAK